MQVRQRRTQGGGHCLFMRAVQIGEQEAYGASLGPAGADRLDGRLDIGPGRRAHRFARRIHALGKLETPLRRHRRRGPCAAEIVHVRADLPADLQQVPEALGGDQRHPAALALEQRIGRDCRAVRQAGYLVERDPAGVRHFPDALEDRPARVVRRRGTLEDMRFAGPVVDGGEVGEGAATSTPTIQDPSAAYSWLDLVIADIPPAVGRHLATGPAAVTGMADRAAGAGTPPDMS